MAEHATSNHRRQCCLTDRFGGGNDPVVPKDNAPACANRPGREADIMNQKRRNGITTNSRGLPKRCWLTERGKQATAEDIFRAANTPEHGHTRRILTSVAVQPRARSGPR